MLNINPKPGYIGYHLVAGSLNVSSAPTSVTAMFLLARRWKCMPIKGGFVI